MQRIDRGSLWDLLIAAALVAIAVIVRVGPLDPPSLWLDDAWVALAYRTSALSDVLVTGLTAPGFVLLLRSWLEVVGFSELKAQLPAFVAGSSAGALCFAIARRRGIHAAAALTGACFLTMAPEHILYSSRVKQYTTDALLVLLIVSVSWSYLNDPDRTSVLKWVAVSSIAATLVSAAVIPAALAALLATGAAAASGGRRTLAPWAACSALYLSFALSWWLLVLRPAIPASLRDFWAAGYIDFDSGWSALARQVWERAEALAFYAFNGPTLITVFLILGAFVVTAWHRFHLGLLLAAPLVVAFLLASLHLAPIGRGRTDIYLLPTFCLAIAAAADPLAKRMPRLMTGASIVALAFLLALVLVLRPGPPDYPAYYVRPLVSDLEARRQPGDRILVYAMATWAYALYTPAPVLVFADPPPGNGLDIYGVEIEDDDVRILRHHLDDPESYDAEVAAAVRGKERVWFIDSHNAGNARFVSAALQRMGYLLTTRQTQPGAHLELWTLHDSGSDSYPTNEV